MVGLMLFSMWWMMFPCFCLAYWRLFRQIQLVKTSKNVKCSDDCWNFAAWQGYGTNYFGVFAVVLKSLKLNFVLLHAGAICGRWQPTWASPINRSDSSKPSCRKTKLWKPLRFHPLPLQGICCPCPRVVRIVSPVLVCRTVWWLSRLVRNEHRT